MKRLTRFASLLMVMAILLAAISACVAPAAAPSGAAEPAAAGEEAAAGGEEVKFEFWHIQTSTPELLQNSVDRFMAVRMMT